MRYIKLWLLVLVSSLVCQSQTNLGFEQSVAGSFSASNSISGWTLECGVNSGINGACFNPTYNLWSSPVTEFSIMTTPVFNDPFVGTIATSPLGGNKIAHLNNTSGVNTITRLTTNLNVTSANNLLYLAYCGSWDGSSHSCCDQAFSRIEIYDCAGNYLNPYSIPIVPGGSNCQANTSTTFSVNSMGISWFNWKTNLFDLTPFVGSCITIKVLAGDCALGGHHGSLYFDAATGSQLIGNGLSNTAVSNPNPVSVCQGGPATIQAPLGYNSYSWTAPSNYPPIPPSQSTLSALTVTNPLAGSVFSVYMNSNNNIYLATYTLAYTNVHIVASGTTANCPMSSNGSATVQAGGSGSGYNYQWISSTNSVISTSSVLSNQPSGTYIVSITAIGSPGCGTATTAIIIPTQTNAVVSYLPKFYCGNTAYLFAGTGTNYQWFNNLSPVTGTIGTAQNFTVAAPTNTDNFSVTYANLSGCRDSIVYSLISYSAPPLSISTNTTCLNASNGGATITLPNNYYPGNNFFQVINSGNTPAYSSSISLSTFPSYSISGLTGGGVYSVTAFDGACMHNSSFTVPTANTDFMIYSSTSPTICPANNKWLSLIFPSSTLPGHYTYSWSPALHIANPTTSVAVNIIPSIPLGTQTLLTYSATVTSTLLNCQLTRTISVMAVNPASPTISPIPIICPNTPFTITVSPPGGYFSGINVSPAGEVPGLPPGTYSFSYATNTLGCNLSVNGGFYVKWAPASVHINGLRNICAGETLTASAMGASSYTWSTGATTNTVLLSPMVNTTYTLTAKDIDGCVIVRTITILSVPKPTLTITGNIICGTPVTTTVHASGAQSYHWHAGPYSNSIVVTPSMVALQFTLSGFNSSFCETIEYVNMVITPLPAITLKGDLAYCKGDIIHVEAEGADHYKWDHLPGGAVFSKPAMSSQTIHLTGINEPGSCSVVKTISITVNECVGLSKYEMANEPILFFPNPFSGKLQIRAQKNVMLDIYNDLGMLIYSELLRSGNTEINTSEWPSGVYFCKGRNYNSVFKLSKVD